MRPLLLLAALLGGCVGAPISGEAPPARAEDPANAWLAQQWADATERVLVEDVITVANVMSRSGGITTLGETLVLPGTARVEVTLTWDAAPGAPEALELLYDSGGSAGGPSAEVASNGEPVVLDATGATDAAFQAHTHWWFGVFPLEGAAPFRQVAVELRAVAFRDAELPLLAPAPRSDAPLVDAPVERVRVGPLCASCEGAEWSSAPGATVTNGTRLVRATLDWSGDTPAPGIVAWTPVAEAIEMEPKGEGVWEVVPPAEALDNEYQTKSLWWFFLSDGAAASRGEGTLRVEVVR